VLKVIRRVREPLHERQIESLRKASGISTFYVFLDMNDFILNLATKGGPEGGDGEAGPNPSWQDRKAVATLYFRPSDAVTSDRFIL